MSSTVIKKNLPAHAPSFSDANAHVPSKKRMGMMLLSLALVAITTGCSTTQEFKPTASVMVGAHTSL